MNRANDRETTELSTTDSKLIEVMKQHLESPRWSRPREDSLRARIMDATSPPPATVWSRPHSSLAAAVLLSLGLLCSFPFFGGRNLEPAEMVSFGPEGGWNYELFAPREFDGAGLGPREELRLPVEYAALEHWVD